MTLSAAADAGISTEPAAAVFTIKPAAIPYQLISMLGLRDHVTLFHYDDEGKREGIVTKPFAKIAAACREAMELAGERHVFADLTGVRRAFKDKGALDDRPAVDMASYAMEGPNGGIHLIHLVHDDDGLADLLDRLHKDETDDAYVANDVPLPYGDYALRENDAARLARDEDFKVYARVQIEAALFGDKDEDDGDRERSTEGILFATPEIGKELVHTHTFDDAELYGELSTEPFVDGSEYGFWPGSKVYGVFPDCVLDTTVGFATARRLFTMKNQNMRDTLRGVYNRLSRHRVGEKEGQSFIGCTLSLDPGTQLLRRLAENVTCVYWLLYDFDSGQSAKEAAERFRSRAPGKTALQYSSYSNRKLLEDGSIGPEKHRLAIPLRTPFVPSDHENPKAVWSATYLATAEFFGFDCDPKCKDLPRGFHGPRHPEGGEFFVNIFAGDLFELQIVMPEERPMAKIAKKQGVALSYDEAGEVYVVGGSGVEFFQSLIGDGPDQLGYHGPIYRTICSCLHPSNEGPDAAPGPIFRLVREAIEKSIKGPGRAQSDIDRYKSDEYLSAELENAREFIRGCIEAKEEAEQEQAERVAADVERATELAGVLKAPAKSSDIDPILRLLFDADDITANGVIALITDPKKKLGQNARSLRARLDALREAASEPDNSSIVDDVVYDPVKVAREVQKRFKSLREERRPIILLDDDHQVDVLNHALAELAQANEGNPDGGLNPAHVLFDFGGNRVRVWQNRSGKRKIVSLTRQVVVNVMKKLLRVTKLVESNAVPEVLAPDWLADQIIVDPDLNLPALRRFVKHPLFDKQGNLHLQTGYDPATGCYIDLDGLETSNIKKSFLEVEWADVEKAVAALDHAFGDFNWSSYSDDANAAGGGSRASYYALLLAPIVREVIDGNMMLFAIDKPDASAGGTTLAEAAHVIWTGDKPDQIRWPGGRDADEELVKLMVAVLKRVPSALVVDNVHGRVGGSLLPALVTGRVLLRILGGNDAFEGELRMPVVLVGNSLAWTDEVARRVLPARIDLNKVPVDAEGNKMFKVKGDLVAYLAEHRSEYVGHLITIVQWWFRQGRPMAARNVESFEEFVSVMGGILEASGIDGWLDGRDAFLADTKKDQSDEIGILQALVDKHGLEKEFTADQAKPELFNDVGLGGNTRYEAKFETLTNCVQNGAVGALSLGRALGILKRKTRQIQHEGTSVDVRLVSRRSNGTRWRIQRV